MKAVQFHEVGGPGVLVYGEIPRPAPRAGEVLLRVAASAYNGADSDIRAGHFPFPIELPHVPGYDVSGTVEAVGEGVSGVSVGQAVIAVLPMERDGGAAEFVIAAADAVVAAPSSIPLPDAAAFPSVALTAWQALFDDGGLQPGQRVLIVGAGGVVGKYAIQLAVQRGIHVIATASPRSIDAVRAAGAHQIIDRTTTEILDAVDGQVDVLLNLAPVEHEELAAYVAVVRDGGAVVSTTASIATPGDDVRGVRAATVFLRPDRSRLGEVVSLVDAEALSVEVTRRIDLVDLPALHEEEAVSGISGKVIVLP